ncbi:probable protein phosphatase 2C 26 isoform X2 [Actinidia eriantha]|uniref:probable protein phosphatase 2C 26 isoform X2 n=1 Tax=Actinidia eriantha TaxID=165200 RepID=UPI00258A1DAD|nr:probable protein phosphatase 2C 26 isoform X2 [Actinidia eriantha]
MAVPIFSSSSPSHSNGWFHTLPTPNISIPQKRNLISCCAASELNPSRSEVRRPEARRWAEQNVDPSLFPRELMVNASDLVGDKEVCSVQLMGGDTIVMDSDGLFDNVFNQEIISTVIGCRDVAKAAKVLANLAHNHSKDSNFDSPYSSEARTRGFDDPWWKKVVGMKLTEIKEDKHYLPLLAKDPQI